MSRSSTFKIHYIIFCIVVYWFWSECLQTTARWMLSVVNQILKCLDAGGFEMQISRRRSAETVDINLCMFMMVFAARHTAALLLRRSMMDLSQ